ncbi:MAG: cytosol nonspecific dipeptidase, partial [Candidatus Hodarchaeota archaeon]
MVNLSDLGKPQDFWEYFLQILEIPRCSRNEEKVRNFIKKEAEKFGFISQIDEIGNIAVKIPAVNLKSKCVLQCHMDMVCEKNEEVIHDFSKDPLKPKIIEIDDEKWITAEGTTLGADNGVGICFLLTL